VKAPTERPIAVQLSGVDKFYGAFQALSQVDLEVRKGEKIVICGPSGSGKSTLIRCINRLEPHDCGRIVVNGIEVTSDPTSIQDVRLEVGMVFQQFNLFPHLTIIENCMLAPQLTRGLTKARAEKLALRFLERVHIGEQALKYPSQLSGGQQQRVAIARALINDPEVLLADEPTGNLDSRTSVEIMAIFQQLNERGITVVMVTHEQDIAGYARRNVVMRDGILLSDKVVTQRTLAEAELNKPGTFTDNPEEQASNDSI
jgi:ABC-type polar amino acid transport system ATPase subunit